LLTCNGARGYELRGSKVQKLILDSHGSYLGRAEGCFEVRDKTRNISRYPHFEKEIGECVLKSGNYVSVDALIDLALWNIDTYIMTRKNRTVAILKNLEDDSHVKTRICQYQALENGKGVQIAKQIVLSKITGQDMVLRKYDLKDHDLLRAKKTIEKAESENPLTLRRKLNGIEGKLAEHYFSQIFQLIPANLRPEKRRGYKAYDGINNVFNFGYYILRCKIHKALIKAKLEPYLGFLHSTQFGKPSLVCDFQELYRYLIDDFLIERYQKLHKNDFVLVTDFMMHLKMGKKIHLCEYETNELAGDLNDFFDHKVDILRIKVGNKQTIETLINEEILLLAKFLRNEKKTWLPRLPSLKKV
jgi:CRISPR-associated protein Cas1